MSKIARYSGNLRAFGSNAQGLERTLFGETTQADDLTSQVTAAFLRGWGVVGPSENPSLEDFNAAFYAISQFIAYQHQMGVPEWDAAQEYYVGSLCVRGGETYASVATNNVGSAPPSAKWTQVLNVKNGLSSLGLTDSNGNVGRLNNTPQSFLTSGSFTPKPGTKYLRVKAVAGGGASGSEAATSGGNGGVSQAGYYGQYIDVIIPVSAFTSPVSIVIGAGGTPGAAGQVTGGAGGTTSFGSIFSLPGGPGGSSMPLTTSFTANGSSLATRSITTSITPINSSGGLSKSSTSLQVSPGTGLGQMPLPSPIEGGYYGSGGIGIFATSTALQGNPGIPGIMMIEEYA